MDQDPSIASDVSPTDTTADTGAAPAPVSGPSGSRAGADQSESGVAVKAITGVAVYERRIAAATWTRGRLATSAWDLTQDGLGLACAKAAAIVTLVPTQVLLVTGHVRPPRSEASRFDAHILGAFLAGMPNRPVEDDLEPLENFTELRNLERYWDGSPVLSMTGRYPEFKGDQTDARALALVTACLDAYAGTPNSPHLESLDLPTMVRPSVS